jgi:hypothetical protein
MRSSAMTPLRRSRSPRRRFRRCFTPGEFLQMVRTGYSAVYRPGSVRFLDHFVVSGQVIQPLEVVDAEGDVVVAFYIMERQADGTWRIAGCKLEGSAAVSA